MGVSEPLISAVICTRNRADYLKLCLAAFEKQSLSSEVYEVIVVDNGSTDGTRGVVEGFTKRNRNFRYYHEDRAGLSIARNSGVRICEGDFVAFTDDDAEPASDWLARLAQAARELPADTGIIGGEIMPVWAIERPEWLGDYLLRPLSAGLKWSVTPRFLQGSEWLVEVNSCYRKSALVRVEGFPESLGRVGETLLSGDSACNVLIGRAGFRQYYDPAILVRHHIPASRMTKTWFRRRSFWQGVSMNIFYRYVEEATERLGLTSYYRPDARAWEEVPVPISLAGWASLFEDVSGEPFERQLQQLEQMGYLLESQSVVLGR